MKFGSPPQTLLCIVQRLCYLRTRVIDTHRTEGQAQGPQGVPPCGEAGGLGAAEEGDAAVQVHLGGSEGTWGG